MKLNFEGDFGKYLNNPNLKIPNAHLNKVCKRRQGSSTCRYISLTLQGFVCVKNTPLKASIDKEVAQNEKWRAKGDNCDGFGE